MPNGYQLPAAHQTSAGESPPGADEGAPSKRDLASWWKRFKESSSNKKEDEKGQSSVLIRSLPVALGGLSMCAFTTSFANEVRLISCFSSSGTPASHDWYFWRSSAEQYKIRKCCHISVRRQGAQFYLRLCSHRGRQMRCFLERKRSVIRPSLA